MHVLSIQYLHLYSLGDRLCIYTPLGFQTKLILFAICMHLDIGTTEEGTPDTSKPGRADRTKQKKEQKVSVFIWNGATNSIWCVLHICLHVAFNSGDHISP